jgi:hypothetical protein
MCLKREQSIVNSLNPILSMLIKSIVFLSHVGKTFVPLLLTSTAPGGSWTPLHSLSTVAASLTRTNTAFCISTSVTTKIEQARMLESEVVGPLLHLGLSRSFLSCCLVVVVSGLISLLNKQFSDVGFTFWCAYSVVLRSQYGVQTF